MKLQISSDARTLGGKYGIPFPNVEMHVILELYETIGVCMQKAGSKLRKCEDYRFRPDFHALSREYGIPTPMSGTSELSHTPPPSGRLEKTLV